MSTPKTYEDNALDQKAIQEAVESVPIKDYSDYEIAIETKEQDHYSDALFGNEEELDQALSSDETLGAVGVIEKPQEKPIEKPESTQSPAPQQQTTSEPQVDSNYQRFLTAGSQTVDGTNEQLARIVERGVNGLIPGTAADYPAFVPASAPPPETAAEKTKQAEQTPAGSLRERIQLKAKSTLEHSKQGLDEYLGRSLPERDMPLDFSLPVQRPKKDFEHIVTAYDIKKLFENKAKSIYSIFAQTHKDLTDLIKCQLSSANRLSLLDTYSSYLAERYTEIFAMLEKKPSLAGDSKRLNLMTNSSAVLKQLISGYKQIYAGYYEGSNVNYGTHRKSIQQTTIRLLDVLLMEQRLAGCLHTALPQSSIKTANKLLLATCLYEPKLLQQSHASEALGSEVTVQAMFVRYQLGLLIKTDNLSSSLYKVFAAYLLSQLKNLSILASGEHKNLAGPVLSIHHEQTDGPAFCAEPPPHKSSATPSLLIPLGGFLNHLQRDYQQALQCLTQPATSHSSPIFSKIKLPYTITVLSALSRTMEQHISGKIDPIYSIYQPSKLKMYTGLDECHAVFDYQYAVHTRKPAKKGEPTPDLPPRPVPNKAQILCAREDDGYLYLQITENKSSKPVDIGQLLLLNGQAEVEQTDDIDRSEDHTGPDRTLIGQVVRIERSLPDKLNMVVEIISEDATAIRLTARPGKLNKALIALHNTQNKQPLIITQQTGQPSAELSQPIEFLDGSSAAINISRFVSIGSKIQVTLIQ